jgi:hypothetical protein
MVACLYSKHKVLSSNFSTVKKKQLKIRLKAKEECVVIDGKYFRGN